MKKYAFLLLLPLFLLTCARQTSPTGGPKDTIPPVLIQSTPTREAINFKGEKIILQFDESVILNNPKEQIMIIPDINKEYEPSSRKNTIILTLKTKLRDSTTYSLNFRDAIQDITEKNSPENLKLAFSTGNYIDSLSISGKTFNLTKGDELKEITVAIYQSDTFNLFKHKPIYITKSDKKGNYILENLKPGKYHLYAFDDKNKNLIVDSKNETYGFIADTLLLKTNQEEKNIGLVKLDLRPLKLTSARPYNTYFNIKMGKSLNSYKLTSTDEPVLSSFGEDQSIIKVYNIYSEKDSIATRLIAFDSANNKLDTTLYVKFSERVVKPEKFQSTVLTTKLVSQTGLLTGKIRFSKPVIDINYDSIYYQIDSLTSVSFTQNDATWDSLYHTLSLQKKLDKKLLAVPTESTTAQSDKQDQNKEKWIYQLNFRPGSFISAERDTSTLMQEVVKPTTQENSGVIIVHTNIKKYDYIVQLRDKSFSIVETQINQSKTLFENLTPGDYLISIVIDYDRNGKWSPGNILRKTEPEPIIYYKNEKNNPIINLKANWEIGPLLITY